MKILYVYQFCVLGGVTTQLANRLRFLRNRCEAHFAFLGDYGGTPAFDGYEHVRITPTVEELAAYMREHRFDVAVTIDTYELYEALRLTDFDGVLIHEVHTTYAEPLRKLAEERSSLPFDHVITPSGYMKGYLASIGIADVYHINNCLDTELFCYREQPSTSERRTVLWVGKLDAHKNWRSYLNVAALLNERRDDLDFTLVGGYSALDGVKREMAERVVELGLVGRFEWQPKIDYDDMYRIYSMVTQNGGVYVSTTANESFGMTVVEAMACRCPVVVPSVGALPELMEGSLEFGLYEPGDERACADRILALLDDVDRRSALIAAGERKAREACSVEAVGEAYMALIGEFLAKRSPRGA